MVNERGRKRSKEEVIKKLAYYPDIRLIFHLLCSRLAW